jgi:hypothetical protein
MMSTGHHVCSRSIAALAAVRATTTRQTRLPHGRRRGSRDAGFRSGLRPVESSSEIFAGAASETAQRSWKQASGLA